ncbi:3'-5' exonuclease [Zobellia nedashkovskayae]
MSHQSYAIVAVNTLAVTEYFHRLIEICIVRITNKMEVERFTSLLNPQTQISSELTEVTGLDNDIVQFEPVFREIAEEILRLLEGAVLILFRIWLTGFYEASLRKLDISLCTPPYIYLNLYIRTFLKNQWI